MNQPLASLALAAALAAGGAAHAQLSSPVPGAAATPATPAAPAAAAGTGPGVHSPNSPFAPLEDRGRCGALVGADRPENQDREEPHPAGVQHAPARR